MAGIFYELIPADPNEEVTADWQESEGEGYDFWINFTAGEKQQEVACAGGHKKSKYIGNTI